jgi:hypothetical protein
MVSHSAHLASEMHMNSRRMGLPYAYLAAKDGRRIVQDGSQSRRLEIEEAMSDQEVPDARIRGCPEMQTLASSATEVFVGSLLLLVVLIARG